jgi:hypothetical protein
VLCTENAAKIRGPIFFYSAVSSEWHVKDILEPFFTELIERKKYMHF